MEPLELFNRLAGRRGGPRLFRWLMALRLLRQRLQAAVLDLLLLPQSPDRVFGWALQRRQAVAAEIQRDWSDMRWLAGTLNELQR